MAWATSWIRQEPARYSLDRPVPFAGREVSAAELLMVLVTHSASHAGEIAAVKGMQGVQGLPY